MTRKSVIARDVKRQKMVERYAVKRAALKEAFLNPENSYEEKMAAFEKLQKQMLLMAKSKNLLPVN